MKKQLSQELKEHKTPKIRINAVLLLVLTGIALAGTMYYLQFMQKPEAQTFMQRAAQQESLGQIEEALLSYDRVINAFPQGKEAPEALLRTARIWHHDRSDPQQALVNYLLLERDYPDSPQQQVAQENAARIVKYDLRDDAAAIGYYQRLLDKHPQQGDRYQYEIADSYLRLENYPQARIELEQLLNLFPESELTADALHRKAMILMIENRPDEAKQVWQDLIDLFPQGSYSSQARFNLARLHEEQGELEEALEGYRQLENFPRPGLLQQKIRHLEQRSAVRNEVTENDAE